jgi:hypothetical protein
LSFAQESLEILGQVLLPPRLDPAKIQAVILPVSAMYRPARTMIVAKTAR